MGKNKVRRSSSAKADRAIPALPAQLRAVFDQAVSAVGSHQLGQAEERLVWLAQQAPDFPPVLHLLGVVLMETNRIEQALPLLKQAARLAPSMSAIHVSLGDAQGRMRQSEAAVESLRKAIRLDAKNAVAYSLLGVVLGGSGSNFMAGVSQYN